MCDEVDLSNAILFADSNHGVYIPQYFAQAVDRSKVHSDTGDNRLEQALDYVAVNPDGEHYWDEWCYITDNCLVTHDGTTYRLYQDGDLWLVPEVTP